MFYVEFPEVELTLHHWDDDFWTVARKYFSAGIIIGPHGAGMSNMIYSGLSLRAQAHAYAHTTRTDRENISGTATRRRNANVDRPIQHERPPITVLEIHPGRGNGEVGYHHVNHCNIPTSIASDMRYLEIVTDSGTADTPFYVPVDLVLSGLRCAMSKLGSECEADFVHTRWEPIE